MDRDTYKGLYSTYLQMYYEGVAKGKAGSSSTDDNPRGAAVTVSSGRGSTMTPAAGLGKDKRHKNNVQGDNNRMKAYKDQIAKDKASDRGISPEARRERARQNKENKAKAGIDSLLKDIRGK